MILLLAHVARSLQLISLTEDDFSKNREPPCITVQQSLSFGLADTLVRWQAEHYNGVLVLALWTYWVVDLEN